MNDRVYDMLRLPRCAAASPLPAHCYERSTTKGERYDTLGLRASRLLTQHLLICAIVDSIRDKDQLLYISHTLDDVRIQKMNRPM